MPLVYLAVPSNYSASGITDQGSIDSTLGTDIGTAIPSPGSAPCRISIKLKVSGSGTRVPLRAFAGGNTLVLLEEIHNYDDYSGARIRGLSRAPISKVLGGIYLEDYETVNPNLQPYTYGPFSRSISLQGWPTTLTQATGSDSVTTVPSTPASNAGNYYLDNVYHAKNFTFGLVGDGHQAIFSPESGTVGVSQDVILNISAYTDTATNTHYFLASSGLLPRDTPYQSTYPIANIDMQDYTSADIRRKPLGLHLSTLANILSFDLPFAGFNPGTAALINPSWVNTVTSTKNNTLKSLAVYPAYSPLVDQQSWCYAAIAQNGRGVTDIFGANATTYVNSYMEAYKYEDESWLTPAAGGPPESNNACGLKPSFAFATNLTSQESSTVLHQYWNSAFPVIAAGYDNWRYTKYQQVAATKYGLVFLTDSYTQHLEFAFRPHHDSWLLEPDLQVINKLLRAPPRSADFRSAQNMAFGMKPGDVATNSIYKVEANDVKANWIHDGGGHIAALGTFNGAVVQDGKIVVWGSNRWGQRIIPEDIKTETIVDVAVAVSPPLLYGWDQDRGFDPHSVYSDDLAELKARTYVFDETTEATGIGVDYFSYPPMIDEDSVRGPNPFARHINFENVPGHIVVVTSLGWVYAWGNNKYKQCDVPDDIKLQSGTNSDKVIEVAAGAFHCVARTAAGKIYVWGAGNKTIGSGTGRENNLKTVHFGQSTLSNSLFNPAVSAAGLTSVSLEFVTGAETYAAGSISDATRGGVVVGQKTSTGFSVADPSVKRLKGLVAAGAFHTAIIDSALKIQCIGAGRGDISKTAGVQVDGVMYSAASVAKNDNTAPNIVSWGSSYSPAWGLFASYPHYCQGINQYSCPSSFVIAGQDSDGAYLFRFLTSTDNNHRARYFQDLQFKKVTCGPFTTHGIVHSVSRVVSTVEQYGTNMQRWLNGRVVSWGCTHGTRGRLLGNDEALTIAASPLDPGGLSTLHGIGTGPTGILAAVNGSLGDPEHKESYAGYSATASSTANINPKCNPAGLLAGTGGIVSIWMSSSTLASSLGVSRAFEIINRPLAATITIDSPQKLVNYPNPDIFDLTAESVGGRGAAYTTPCPITISRFKVKDVASCGDYTAYITALATAADVPTLGSYTLALNSGVNNSNNIWVDTTVAEPFTVLSPVVFTGHGFHRPKTSIDASGTYTSGLDIVPWGRPHANNPFSGTKLVRNNKLVSDSPVDAYSHLRDTGLTSVDSLYYGPTLRASATTETIGSTAYNVKYVLPTSIYASNNFTVMVINMDNRPVAWNGYHQPRGLYKTPLDLSILPSIPLQSIKTGKGHIIGVSKGDWPIARTLAYDLTPDEDRIPSLVTKLGTKVFDTTAGVKVSAELIYGAASQAKNPAIVSWGAGDGREAAAGLLAFPRAATATGLSNGINVYSSGFLDIHAISRLDTAAGGPVIPLVKSGNSWENYYGHYRWLLNSTQTGKFFGDIYLSSSPTQNACLAAGLNSSCCTSICEIYPPCCEVWDSLCITLSQNQTVCGACSAEYPVACCYAVCNDHPECCETWTSACTAYATGYSDCSPLPAADDDPDVIPMGFGCCKNGRCIALNPTACVAAGGTVNNFCTAVGQSCASIGGGGGGTIDPNIIVTCCIGEICSLVTYGNCLANHGIVGCTLGSSCGSEPDPEITCCNFDTGVSSTSTVSQGCPAGTSQVDSAGDCYADLIWCCDSTTGTATQYPASQGCPAGTSQVASSGGCIQVFPNCLGAGQSAQCCFQLCQSGSPCCTEWSTSCSCPDNPSSCPYSADCCTSICSVQPECCWGEWTPWCEQLSNTLCDIEPPVPPPHPTSSALDPGHQAIEAMQSLLFFRQDYYPSTPIDTAANYVLFNGTLVSAIPAGAYLPWSLSSESFPITSGISIPGASNSINHWQEYHGPLGLYIQNPADYVIDYAAGALHTAVLFRSSIVDFTKVTDGTAFQSLANFRTHFMVSGVTGSFPHFRQRRVCKLGLMGYGCEGQTAGLERRLADNSLAPIVPQLFSPAAKVYCGDSFTLVTDPIRVETVSSAETDIEFDGSNELSIPITIPAAKASRRFRGFDLVLTFNPDSGADLIFSALEIVIKYKNKTLTVVDQVVKLSAPLAETYIDNSQATSVVFSNRFGASAYTYTDVAAARSYSEAGVSITSDNAYAAGNTLKSISTTPSVKDGCYYPASISGSSEVEESWVLTDNDVVIPFEGSFEVLITDHDGAQTPTNWTITASIIAEVDADDIPYRLYGPNRSGIWRNTTGSGPSYIADLQITDAGTVDPTYTPADRQLDILSAPIDYRPTLDHRLVAQSFPNDADFLCGTYKYGPAGNRETYAADVFGVYGATALFGGKDLTANFFNVFTVIPHRPNPQLEELLNASGANLLSLPKAAFINPLIDLGNVNVLLALNSPNSVLGKITLLYVNTPAVACLLAQPLPLPVLNHLFDLGSASIPLALGFSPDAILDIIIDPCTSD